MRNRYHSLVLKLLRHGKKRFSVLCVEGTVICTSLQELYLILYVMKMTNEKADLSFFFFFSSLLSVSAPGTKNHLILEWNETIHWESLFIHLINLPFDWNITEKLYAGSKAVCHQKKDNHNSLIWSSIYEGSQKTSVFITCGYFNFDKSILSFCLLGI